MVQYYVFRLEFELLPIMEKWALKSHWVIDPLANPTQVPNSKAISTTVHSLWYEPVGFDPMTPRVSPFTTATGLVGSVGVRFTLSEIITNIKITTIFSSFSFYCIMIGKGKGQQESPIVAELARRKRNSIRIITGNSFFTVISLCNNNILPCNVIIINVYLHSTGLKSGL